MSARLSLKQGTGNGNGNGNGSGNGSGNGNGNQRTLFKRRISCEKYNLYFVGLTDRKLCVSTKYKLQKTNVVNYLKKQLSREMSKLLKFNKQIYILRTFGYV